MRYAVAADGSRFEPCPNSQARCPCCGGEVRSKCGSIRTWHWAHHDSDCDPWSEPETEWHRLWKDQLADPDHQEVVMERGGRAHRADAVITDGTVVELQTTFLSPDEIAERESFYGRMVWLYRCYWSDRLQGRFWWKNGSRAMAGSSKPIFWHFPQTDQVACVRLSAHTKMQLGWRVGEDRKLHEDMIEGSTRILGSYLWGPAPVHDFLQMIGR